MTTQTPKANLIALLQECIEQLEMADFSPVLYRTLGALHEYSGHHAGLPLPATIKATTASRPCFQTSGGVNGVFASGWMEEMSTSTRSSSSTSTKQIVWKPILALLVQKDKEEPCLWITREILALEEGEGGGSAGEPELETLHRIPMRRLQSVEYVDFYGDYRLALRIKRRDNDLIFRCNDDGAAALAWVQQLEVAKSKGRGGVSVGGGSIKSNDNKMDEVDQSVELEMDETTGEVMNLNQNAQEDDDAAAEDARRRMLEEKRIADRLQEAEDMRRLRKENQYAEAKERKKQNAEEAERASIEAAAEVERLKQEQAAAVESQKLAQVAEAKSMKERHERAARVAMEQALHEQQERQKGQEEQALQQRDDEKRRREFENEQQKKAAAEKRRQDLAEQRKAAQEEQKKKNLEEKRKFLATEQRKLDLIANAKAGKGNTPASSSLMDKLNNQMSALDAADRMRAEEAKKNPKEEIQQEFQEPEDVETARKRIAEEARQRLIPGEAEKLRKQAEEQARVQQQRAAVEETRHRLAQEEAESLRKQTEERTRMQQHQAWSEQQRRQAAQHQAYGAVQQCPQPTAGQPKQQAWQTAQNNQQQQQAWNQWHQQQQQQARAAPQSQQPQYQQQQQYGPQHRPQSASQTPGYYGQRQPHVQQGQLAGQQHPQQQQQQPQPTHPQAATAPSYPSRINPSQPAHHPPTGVDMKYTQMAQQAQQEEQSSSTTALKRNILLHWALQPPANQILRTIDQLLCNVHSVYPPAFGVPAHSHFTGWQVVSRTDICSSSGSLDEERLKKAVRKLRFFLHPDKLPRDLTEEQLFMCKLLWDVSNDAWEDHKKALEELDWVG